MQLVDKNRCCGCGACYNACPVDAIAMKQDEEGFLYPSIDELKCVECGKCRKACPSINRAVEKEIVQTGWIVQHKDSEILRESTSGGAFTALACFVLKRGGVVFGAAFRDDWTVSHVEIEQINDLERLRNSKYVQSSIGDIFRKVREAIRQDRWVLFSGTPCQSEGLISYLDGTNEKLIMCDIVCRSIVSPGVWKRYIDSIIEQSSRPIGAVRFREKLYGYKYSALTVRDMQDRLCYANGVDTDPYLRAFFSDVSVRPSCYDCQFKTRYRRTDFTIWDCFNTYDFSKKLDDNRGVTRVLIHTEKGRKIFEELKDDLRMVEIEPNRLVQGVRELTHSVHYNPQRERFFEDYGKMDISELFEKYYPITMKTKLEKMVRVFCAKTGIYGVAIRMYKSIVKKQRRNR